MTLAADVRGTKCRVVKRLRDIRANHAARAHRRATARSARHAYRVRLARRAWVMRQYRRGIR